jgi:hypothetical protein
MGHQMPSELPGPVPNLGEDSGIQKMQNPRVPIAISANRDYYLLVSSFFYNHPLSLFCWLYKYMEPIVQVPRKSINYRGTAFTQPSCAVT